MCFENQDVSRGSSRANYVLLALIIIAGIAWSLLRVGLWWTPEWGDEAHYVLSGWRIAQGERIYVDFFDGAQKPPLMHWTAAAAVKLLGNKAVVFPILRALTILCRTATIILIFFIGRMLASDRAGLVAAVLFSFHAVAARLGNRYMTEAYSTLFALLGLWLFLKSLAWMKGQGAAPGEGKPGCRFLASLGLFGAGLSMGIGMLYRPTPVFLALAVGLALLVGKAGWQKRLQALGLFVGGIILALLPLALYLALNHAFHNFYLMVVKFNLLFPPQAHSLPSRLRFMRVDFFQPLFYRWLVAAALVVAVVQGLRRKKLALLVVSGWLGLQVLVMLLVVRQVAWHYFYDLLPAFVLLFAVGFERLLLFAKAGAARLDGKRDFQKLLAGGGLPALVVIFLPACLLVLFYHVQWAAINWRAGLSPTADLPPARIIWLSVTIMAAGLHTLSWRNRRKYLLFLTMLVFWSVMLLPSPGESRAWKLASTAAVSLCFTFACASWLAKFGQALSGEVGSEPAALPKRARVWLARSLGNPRRVVLWLCFIWLLVGQVETLARQGPPRTSLKDTEKAVAYLRDGLAGGYGMVSLVGEVNFLLGKPIPIYWGYNHEEVSAGLGIAKMVDRRLADVPAYCEKQRVRFIVFYRGGRFERMGPAGAAYIRTHFGGPIWFGPYKIYERPSLSDLR